MYNTTFNLLCIDNKRSIDHRFASSISHQSKPREKTKNKINFNSYIQMVSKPLQTNVTDWTINSGFFAFS